MAACTPGWIGAGCLLFLAQLSPFAKRNDKAVGEGAEIGTDSFQSDKSFSSSFTLLLLCPPSPISSPCGLLSHNSREVTRYLRLCKPTPFLCSRMLCGIGLAVNFLIIYIYYFRCIVNSAVLIRIHAQFIYIYIYCTGLTHDG